jgi:cell division GTPase FtsZ
LRQAVEGVSDLITTPGNINLDFADIKAIMEDAGSALKVELVERRSKKHLVETEKFPQDTLFYPTGRFATEDGTLIPQSEPEVA